VQSCLYEGRLRHRRFSPTENTFAYRLFMVYLDLEEMEDAFRCHPLWSVRHPNLADFTRGDHLGDARVPLHTSVRDLIEEQTGNRPSGPVRLLTHFRYFGYRFNPVSFYYAHDAEGTLDTIVAEINNTPWGEQHTYVLSEELNVGTPTHRRYEFDKSFHVSPFMPMDHDYTWRFTDPDERLAIHMDNHDADGRCFDATLTMTRTELSRTSLSRVLIQYPLMTAQVIASIYWQATKLWLKGTPVYDHPATTNGN